MSTYNTTSIGDRLTDLSNGKGHLLVDMHGLPRFNGNSAFQEQLMEACEGYYYGQKTGERKYVASRIKAQLFGEAKEETKSKRRAKEEQAQSMHSNRHPTREV